MNRMDLLNKIVRYLANFQEQIKISTDNNQYDINIHAETILIPLFNIIFKGDFENLHFTDKNAKAIDLLDRTSGIAIQVTSTKDLAKIKNTLTKLKGATYYSAVKKLYVYILSTKQASYSTGPLTRILGNKIAFNAKNNIWDSRDLYKSIQAIADIDMIKNIENLLRKNFSELYLTENFTLNDYETFRNKYKQICIDNFSRLNFFGLSVQRKPREVDLYHLFVKPRFNNTYKSYWYNASLTQTKLTKEIADEIHQLKMYLEKEIVISQLKHIDFEDIIYSRHLGMNNPTAIEFKKLFSHNKHIVLLGNPGAGKSSIIKYSICKILEKDMDTFDDKKVFDTLPLRIEVHKYNQFKIDKKTGIVDYLSALLSEEYQQQLSAKDLTQVLKYYRTTVFFDGLDEIFDIQQRLAVRNDIESFIKTFDKVRSLVTSRFESYTEVSLEESKFIQLEVQNFEEDQIEDYVKKWYGLEEQNTKIKREEVNNCLKQLKHVDSELKCNPLLLSLILILYRNELEIPTSKLEIYENCTNTIVDHRDNREKKLLFNLTITNPVAIFSALAYWQFENQTKELNAAEVLKFVKKHLIDKGEIEDDLQATKATEQFLDFAKVRSIYFENKFTHKTFLEYFTSYFIYSNLYAKPKNHPLLDQLITKNLGLSSWAVVLELLICKIDSMQIDFEMIDGIMEKQLEKNQEHAILFFLNIIRYLKNVSPKIRQKLINAAISSCVDSPNHNDNKDKDMRENLFTALVSLSKIDRFNEPIKSSFNLLIKQAVGTDIAFATFAYEFQLTNPLFSLDGYLNPIPEDAEPTALYLLRNFDKVRTKETHLLLIKDIVKKTGKTVNIKMDFSSKYGQAIFLGSSTINLLLTYMHAHKPENLESAYRNLLDSGIPFEDLKKIAAKLGQFYNVAVLKEAHQLTTDKEIKKLIKISFEILESKIQNLTGSYGFDTVISSKKSSK